MPAPPLDKRLLRSLAGSLPPVKRLLAERDGLRAERDRLRTQRDRLRGELDHRADRGRYDYVFVVTYGRSGSTLLQGILNSIPGYLVRGENRAAMYRLYQMHTTCLREKDRLQRPRTLNAQHPWFGMDKYPDEVALEEIWSLAMRTLIRPRGDSRTVGFKEIRWQYDDLDDYLDFLRAVFPRARFLFNSRCHRDVAVSAWWADKADPFGQLERAEAQQERAAARLGDSAFRIRYDDYVNEPAALGAMFDWLGAPFDEEAVSAQMAKRHSY